MKRKINFDNKVIDYTLKTNRRSKRIRLAVNCDGSLVVTKPRWVNARLADNFIGKNLNWIISKISYFKNKKFKPLIEDKKFYSQHKKNAYNFINERIKYFGALYSLTFNQIKIKNQKTRWGSCSKKGNLNFNYKILFLPKNVADYIIVHELCHLKEFNHSSRFWDLVAKAIPDYKAIRRFLRNNSIETI